MVPDTPDDRVDATEKIDVRVPAHLLERIDEEYERRGYTSRSEAIRDALRSWIDPPVMLSDEILDDLVTSRKQRERGQRYTLEEVRERCGLDRDGRGHPGRGTWRCRDHDRHDQGRHDHDRDDQGRHDHDRDDQNRHDRDSKRDEHDDH